jgi:DNA-binding beta-propeller fold protein YncE
VAAAPDPPSATRGTRFFARHEISLFAADGRPGFREPGAVSVDLFGNIFVADTGNHRVVQFDPRGRRVFEFGGYGWREGELSSPSDVCAREGFRLFVVDAGNERVQQFHIRDATAEGSVLPFAAGRGFADQELVRPQRMDLDAEGRSYVTDELCHCVWIFSPVGQLVARLGGLGEAATRFRSPAGVAVDARGRAYVADAGNRRVQVFDAIGNWLATWGGGNTNLFVEPAGIAVAPDGGVWVADRGTSRVILLSATGEFVFAFGGQGDGPGTFRRLTDVEVGPDGRVWVADAERGVVEGYRIERVADEMR